MPCVNTRKIYSPVERLMSLASPFWQGILFFVAGIFLLWETWEGWRRGVIRSMIHFAAWALSGFAGIYIGYFVTAIVEKFLPASAFFIGLLTGSFAALFILGALLLFGAVIFKRTAQQPSSMIRLLYGIGGAFFGFLTGLLLLWGGISLIRASGAIAESAMTNRSPSEAPASARMLITLKESLELEPAGKIVKSVDMVSPQTYDTILRLGKLRSDEKAMRRFLDCPNVQEILQNPSMAALLQDPQVVQAVETGNIFSLMQSKVVLNAINDPELKKLLFHFDLQKALDYACPPRQTLQTQKKQP